MVTLTRSPIDAPAARRTAARLRSACSVWASIPSAAAPVPGSIPAVPEQKTKPPATIAWLYGPSAAGAWSLDTACRVMAPPLLGSRRNLVPHRRAGQEVGWRAGRVRGIVRWRHSGRVAAGTLVGMTARSRPGWGPGRADRGDSRDPVG